MQDLSAGRGRLAALPALALLTGTCRREVENMQVAAQGMEATRIAVLLAAIGIVAFWRTVLRYVIMLVSITVIATLGYGAIMIWQGMHHIAR
jgi:hypothetical protein